MKDRSLIFNSAMVEAILCGRKTQMRRVIEPEWIRCLDLEDSDDAQKAISQCPHGLIDDHLWWVKETWQGCNAAGKWWHEVRRNERELHNWAWTNPVRPAYEFLPPKWISPYFMHRSTSRISLQITDVRIQRVNDISDDDAKAEGVPPNWVGHITGWNEIEHGYLGVVDERDALNNDGEDGYYRTAKQAFAEIWNSINDERGYGWSVNPWVFAITFKFFNVGDFQPEIPILDRSA